MDLSRDRLILTYLLTLCVHVVGSLLHSIMSEIAVPKLQLQSRRVQLHTLADNPNDAVGPTLSKDTLTFVMKGVDVLVPRHVTQRSTDRHQTSELHSAQRNLTTITWHSNLGLWDVMTCTFVNRHKRFGPYYTPLPSMLKVVGGDKFLRKVGIYRYI
jgi:hypothetical protein